MKTLLPAACLFLLFSCAKTDPGAPAEISHTGIIKDHVWYAYSVHELQYNDNTNSLLKDTTIIYGTCGEQQPYKFFNDSVVNRNLVCLSVGVKEGKWYLSSDSIFSANIPLLRGSYSTGYTIINAGFNPSKLLEIDDQHFVLFEKQVMYGYDYTTIPVNISKIRTELITTYKNR